MYANARFALSKQPPKNGKHPYICLKTNNQPRQESVPFCAQILTELLNGPDVSDLMTAINTAVSEAQVQTIGPILASVDHNSTRYIHTLVPISDASGTTVTRLFIYSEKVDQIEGEGSA